jgi:asparagine synthase (glutamine-hydrolysing)
MIDYIDANLRSFCNDFPQFRYEGLKAQLDRLKKGEGEVVNRLWTIYFLMNWFRRWMA